MAESDYFSEAIEEKNIRKIRIFLKNSLTSDTSFKTFNEMEAMASKVSGLYDRHNGESFDLDKNNWNDNYLAKLKVELIDNFSHERIEHLKNVITYLEVSKNKRTNNNIGVRKSSNKTYIRRNDEDTKKAKMIIGTVGGGIAGGIVFSIIGMSTLGGVAIGAIVGGIGTGIISKGD